MEKNELYDVLLFKDVKRKISNAIEYKEKENTKKEQLVRKRENREKSGEGIEAEVKQRDILYIS